MGSDTSGIFSLHFAQPSYHFERPALTTGKCSYVGAELIFVAANVLQKPDNRFLVPSLCKLNHISLARNHLQTAYSLEGKQCLFLSHPQCFGPLGRFQHNIKISIKTARVSRLSVSYDYDQMKLVLKLIF